MKVQQAPVQRRISQVAAHKAQKVHYSDISNLKSQLKEVKNNTNGLGNSLFNSNSPSSLQKTANNLLARLENQGTKATADKTKQVLKLSAEIKSLIGKDATTKLYNSRPQEIGRARLDQENKNRDLKNEHKNHIPSLGLNTNKPSHLQFEN
ncbi:TPA: hypothetical protein PXM28_003855 [Yersinia enterocolitica]|nr:hypothetical protein [Yersinia enterocolitica]